MEILILAAWLWVGEAGAAEDAALQKLEAKAAPYGFHIAVTTPEVERINSVVERQRVWFLLDPCRLPRNFPRDQDFSALGLQAVVQEIPGSPGNPDRCKLTFQGAERPIAALRVERGKKSVEIDLFHDVLGAEIFDADREVRRLVQAGAEQEPLRLAIGAVASRSGSAYAEEVLRGYFKGGTYPLVVAGAHGVCHHFRYEFLQQLLDLQLPSLFAGTPDEPWLGCCLEIFRALEQFRADENTPLESAALEALAFRTDEAGDLAARYLWKRLTTLAVDSEEARKANFLLSLHEASKGDVRGQVKGLERALYGEKAFYIEVRLQDGLGCNPEEATPQRLDRTNLSFLKATLDRDKLRNYPEALKEFRKLAKLPKTENLVSFHSTENAYVKPAAVEARAELAKTLLASGDVRKACETWADLAWQESNTRMVGLDEEETYCQYALGQIEQFCGKETAAVLKMRVGKYRRAAPACRSRFQATLKPTPR